MDLILWRHADAEIGTSLLPDAERQLSAKGIKQASKMAGWLNTHLPENCRILVSPTLRTRQTANALKRKYKIVDELAPGASVDTILANCHWPDHKRSVLIIGHQPTLGMLAARLLFPGAVECDIRKGSVWWITQKAAENQITEHYLKVVMAPSLLSK